VNPAFRILAAGALAGSLAWLVFSRAASPLEVPPDGVRRPPPASISVADALAMPVFAEPAAGLAAPAPAAQADPSGGPRLVGVILTPRRRAALISVGGAPAAWIGEGQTVGGLTVTRLTRNGAEITDASGARRLKLFQNNGAPVIQPAQPPLAGPAGLPPASAPPTGPGEPSPKGG
jgi:hypothetical protein